jgi:Rps23 Pro-64 3,4-dihydroxylase Tpa1-like proline 4-hydroxylase
MINKKNEWEFNKKEWGFGRTTIDNFLDEKTINSLYEECMNAPKGGWTVFTRAGSRMEEFNDLISLPTAHRVTYDIMHSGEFLYELEQMTGIVGLLPDPHLVGAGYSIIKNGKNLGCHYDFNWNDRIRLHRKLTCLLYITPDWKDEWGGHIQYYDDNVDINPNAALIESISPKFNRFVINENVKQGPYHRVSAVNAPGDIYGRCAIRFFYYVSTSEPDKDNPPHRSTYKSNEYAHHKLYEEEKWDGHFVGQGGEDYSYTSKNK